MRLGRNFVVYLGSSVVSGMLPLALMPFLTHSLDPAQYGVMATIITIVALIGPVVNWATTSYVAVQYFKVPAGAFPALLSSVMLIPAASTVVLVLLFAVGREQLAAWFGVPDGWNLLIPLMAAGLLLPQFAQTVLAMRDRAIGFAAFEISVAALNFVGTVGLVLLLGLGWQGRIIAAALASALVSVAALVWLARQGLLVRRLVLPDIRDALRFGGGGVPHDLANQASRLSDRLLIVALIGQAAMGSYAVAVQWSSIMLTVLSAFNRAWTPFLFSTLAKAEPGSPRRIVKQTYLVWGAFAAFFVLFNLATPIGYHLLVNSRYHASMPVVFWLTLGFLFTAIYITFVDYIFYLKKTHILATITVGNLMLNVTLSYLLINVYGAVGASIAFAITAAIVMCLTIVVSHRLHPMPWLEREPQ